MLNDYADLHLHTTFSDGFSSPAEVLKSASRHHLKTISITDHDTTQGIAISIAESEKYGIEVIPGIELSASTEDGEIHLLGYFIDYQDTTLLKILNEVKEKRIERLKRMVNNLAALNIHINIDDLLKFAGPGTVGRLHLAHFLRNNKIVSHIYEAFDKYIGNGKPAYEKVNAFTPQEAIKLICNAGGIPVLAHPPMEKFDELMGSLIPMGLQGLEVYHPSFGNKDSYIFLTMAKKYNLLITGGSDCHGEGKLTPSMGKVKLASDHVVKLKEHAGINCSIAL